jgi:tetratricopeptide (TPR) repeat protein
VLGRSISEFQQEFFAWCGQQVSKWGYDEETSKKYNELKPKADALSKGRQDEAAVKAWQEILALRPMDPLPRQRLAVSYLALKKYPEAIEQLDALHQAELKDNRYGKRIARLYRDLKDWDKAKLYGMQSVYIDPYDVSAHELLADIYEKAGDAKGLEREKRVIPVLKEWYAAQKRQRDEGLPGAGAQ